MGAEIYKEFQVRESQTKGLVTCKLQFVSADRADSGIIAYGYLDRTVVYKVVFVNDVYKLFYKAGSTYKYQVGLGSLQDCIDWAFESHKK